MPVFPSLFSYDSVSVENAIVLFYGCTSLRWVASRPKGVVFPFVIWNPVHGRFLFCIDSEEPLRGSEEVRMSHRFGNLFSYEFAGLSSHGTGVRFKNCRVLADVSEKIPRGSFVCDFAWDMRTGEIQAKSISLPSMEDFEAWLET